jgi:hypothetical protein
MATRGVFPYDTIVLVERITGITCDIARTSSRFYFLAGCTVPGTSLVPIPVLSTVTRTRNCIITTPIKIL